MESTIESTIKATERDASVGRVISVTAAGYFTVFVGRGFAVFWGVMFGLDVVGRLFSPGFDATLWWVDIRAWPWLLAYGLLATLSALLLSHGLRPVRSRGSSVGLAVLACVATVAMMLDGVQFLGMLCGGQLRSDFPVPMSFISAASLLVVVASVVVDQRDGISGLPSSGVRGRAILVGAAGFLAIGFPLAQMFCFGLTDYTRKADVAVVFGARAYANGQLSNALQHRVHTACGLYHRRIVAKLMFSGGPGDGAVHETEAMRLEAIKLGVLPGDILVDSLGVSTRATVRNTVPMLRAAGLTRVLAVSHFYHLPRVKMCYQASGMDVWTVPAVQARLLRQMPWLLVREIGGLWAYYVRAVMMIPSGL